MRRWGGLFLIFLAFGCQKKTVVRTIDELPLFHYPVQASVAEWVANDTLFMQLAKQVKIDQEKILRHYQIEDSSAQKRIYYTLLNVAMLEKDHDRVLSLIEKLRSIEKKPADRMVTGLILESMTRAKIAAGETGDYREQFRRILTEQTDSLPWTVVHRQIIALKGRLELWNANLLSGTYESQIQPSVDKTGELSGEQAAILVSLKVYLQELAPLQDDAIAVLEPLIQSHASDKPDIWKERSIALSEKDEAQPIVIGIWDTGVDASVFPKRMFINRRERADGLDNDGNGFVDDIHGIAYNLQEDKSTDLLLPISSEQRKKLPLIKQDVKGLLDLLAGIDSPQSSQLKKKIAELQKHEVQVFQEETNLFALYVHGTHVAGIAVKDNPFARILIARVSFDYHTIQQPFSIELAQTAARNYCETVRYFQLNGVRVVNVSWGLSFSEIERNLESNGIGGSQKERRELARKIFAVYRDGLYQALQSAPEILFLTAAGNTNSDVAFDEFIPSAFDLPNLLTVAAVDQAGEPTSFTSFGKSVDLYANGFEIESTIPGGDVLVFSGTSMAAPQVTNLAAKLLALDPALTTADLLSLILTGADQKNGGKVPLINPAESCRLLKEELAGER